MGETVDTTKGEGEQEEDRIALKSEISCGQVMLMFASCREEVLLLNGRISPAVAGLYGFGDLLVYSGLCGGTVLLDSERLGRAGGGGVGKGRGILLWL